MGSRVDVQLEVCSSVGWETRWGSPQHVTVLGREGRELGRVARVRRKGEGEILCSNCDGAEEQLRTIPQGEACVGEGCKSVGGPGIGGHSSSRRRDARRVRARC